MALDYPLHSFHFQVIWGDGTNIAFSEVSGLGMTTEVIEYRHGASPDYSVTKMPGIQKYDNITLKRGVFANDNAFFEWWQQTRILGGGDGLRRDLTVTLLNANHEPVVVWKIRNAFPVQLKFSDLKATANDFMIESLEIAHEGMIVEHT
jgi:phage tail-like protein